MEIEIREEFEKVEDVIAILDSIKAQIKDGYVEGYQPRWLLVKS